MQPNTSPLQSDSATGTDITPEQLRSREVLAEACEMIHSGLSAELRWSSAAQPGGAR
jgi:hypothetical protein